MTTKRKPHTVTSPTPAKIRAVRKKLRSPASYARKVGKHPALAAPFTTSANWGGSPIAALQSAPDFGAQVMLVGDIVSGFDAYGPFDSPSSAVDWKQRKGNRELTQGQWFLLPLKGVE